MTGILSIIVSFIREKLAKYQAIEKAFKVKTKPIAKRYKSWLARRRWKA